MATLTFERLRNAVAGDAVAVRSRMTLQPVGGEGDKVFPPSYSVDGSASHKYAEEKRRVGDNEEPSITVLLEFGRFPSEQSGVVPTGRLGSGGIGVPGSLCGFQ